MAPPLLLSSADETHQDAVAREIRQTRNSVGLLDASTLGKLLVQGPDAAKFLDMLYTNMMSTLKIGKMPLWVDVFGKRLFDG